MPPSPSNVPREIYGGAFRSTTTPTIEPLNIQSEQFIYLNYFMILILMLFGIYFVSVCYCIVAACKRGWYFITITTLLEHSTLPRHYIHISSAATPSTRAASEITVSRFFFVASRNFPPIFISVKSEIFLSLKTEISCHLF